MIKTFLAISYFNPVKGKNSICIKTVIQAVILLFGYFELLKVSNVHNNACSGYFDYLINFWSNKCYYNPHVLSSTDAMILDNGYIFERYNLTTEDDYDITLFRIPRSLDGRKAHKPPVFLLHGILLSSSVWVFKGRKSLATSDNGTYIISEYISDGPKQSQSYIQLADRGHDVWLGSVRGCPQCKTEKYHETPYDKYWRFNLDTLAQYDISEQLQFIADMTGQGGQITYIGYSMGSTLGFMYASEYQNKTDRLLSGLVTLAPVVHLKEVPLVRYHTALWLTEAVLRTTNSVGVFTDVSKKMLINFCTITPWICKFMFAAFFGPFSEQFEPDDLLLLAGNSMEGTSLELLTHYLQLLQANDFHKYNYGEKKNLEIYGRLEPPTYNLSEIDIPVALLYGTNDYMSTKPNVDRLFKELGSTYKVKQVIPSQGNVTSFNHVDFLMAKDIEKCLYSELFKILESEAFQKVCYV